MSSAAEIMDDERPKRRRRPRTLAREPKLRFEAGLVYMTDPQSPSIDSLSRDPRFSKVSKKTLERWAKEDGWVDKRTEFFESWASRARERMGSELCRLRQRDLQDLETIRQAAFEKLGDALTMPKSWEGVAKVLLESTIHRERIASLIGAELMPQHEAEKKPVTHDDVGVAPEELQVAAREILRFRRQALQQEMMLTDGTPAPVIDVSADLAHGDSAWARSNPPGDAGFASDDSSSDDDT